jgi:hypothetical protein
MTYNQHTRGIFIDKAVKKHNDRYDYTLVEYINSKTKVDIKCEKHGIFKQTPNSHLSGRGCEKCSYELRSVNKKNKTFYRKWVLNENYFNVIDTEHKAYFLGLLYADGSVNKDKSITLGLNEQDLGILLEFNKELKYNKPLKYSNNMFVCVINSQKMYNDLLDKGCMERKTFKIKFPDEKIVPRHLIWHFIRGYFDGDGCIYIGKKSYTNYVNFLGNYDFINEMSKYINDCIEVKNDLRKKGNIWSLSYRTKDRLILLRDILYSDANVFFLRKKEKFDLI